MLGLNPLWITFGPVILINLFVGITIPYYYLTGRENTHPSHDAARRNLSPMLSRFLREWWVWWTDPMAQFLVKMKMTPNIITFIGFLFAPFTAFLFAKGLFGYAGWLMVLGASFDLFDGRVARLTNKMSRSGAYFDSVMDRFSEGICFIGLAFYFHESWVFFFVIAGLIGSMMVSYTRARGEVLKIDCTVGSMQRPERIVYLGVAGIFQPVASLLLLPLWSDPAPVLVIASLLIIGVMTNATAIRRIVFVMNTLDTEDRRFEGRESIPQIMNKLASPKGREELWGQFKKHNRK